MIRATRFVLYALLFACTTVLLGLTAYRVHYTKSLDHPDVLTTSTHFYDPRIVALMVASILGVMFSLAMIAILVARLDLVLFEIGCIGILWIFFLITAALVTRRFSNLKWCRSHHKVCSVLETIKAFGWICWGLLSILFILAVIVFYLSDTGSRTNHGTPGPHPDTRQTNQANAPATVHGQTQGVPVTHASGAKQGPLINQQQAPTTTTAHHQGNNVESGHIV